MTGYYWWDIPECFGMIIILKFVAGVQEKPFDVWWLNAAIVQYLFVLYLPAPHLRVLLAGVVTFVFMVVFEKRSTRVL